MKYEIFWLTTPCSVLTVLGNIFYCSRSILSRWTLASNNNKILCEPGQGQTLDEWHVSDPLYDNYNMDHLLRFTNGSALPSGRPALNATPGAELGTQLGNYIVFSSVLSLWKSGTVWFSLETLDIIGLGPGSGQVTPTRQCDRSSEHTLHSPLHPVTGPTLTNYYSITVSPEVGLTSANRSVSVCPCSTEMSIIVCVHSGRYIQQTWLLWIRVLCWIVINQVLVSSGAALRKRWHGLLFATIRGPDVMNS